MSVTSTDSWRGLGDVTQASPAATGLSRPGPPPSITGIRVADTEIASWAFRHVEDVRDEMRDHIRRRLHTAFDAVTDGPLRYSERDS